MIKAAAITEFVAAAFLSNSVTLASSIIAGILGVGTLVAVVYGAKWKATVALEQARANTAESTATLWEQNARGERDRADVALADKVKLQQTIDEQRNSILELRALPNVETLARVMAAHEDRAQERQQAILTTVHNLAEQSVTLQGQNTALVGLVQQLVDHLAKLNPPAAPVPA